ncbi:nucleoside/nucleotide kinase family protein [Nocardioides acrostichi]|uniref:Nucleoside/nucleotide kinase family protein n=1 Tax=Nocardioides acrostichi TaxID=2784339 RepID=A0A930Y752_9ACTN|nr:nucleoside/nucleotide kinase family protein [Nocardioides acrostichi]MBF4161677.1 nucleoside/nucleotide kinase family protein [Nocardioides acrostichi]
MTNVDALAPPPDVRLLGLTGSPGAGKSTLARRVAAQWGAAVVPLDGFHYADVELERRGLRRRKGAPDTFDAEGLAALLRRIRDGEPDVVAPMFERDLEQPLAGAIPVPAAGLVIVEGNYLLLEETRWRKVREQLDAVWHLRLDDAVRMQRLIERHVEFGKARDEAEAWVAAVDVPNAERIEAAAHRADRVITLV